MKVKQFNENVSFKETKDEIRQHMFVTDGTDIGFVSYADINEHLSVNWFGKQNTTQEEKDFLKAVRPRFQTNKLHGEIWKGSYLILNYLLEKDLPISIKPKYYRKPIEINDTVTISDYRLLYKYKDLINLNLFKITNIDNRKITIKCCDESSNLSFDLTRNQIKLQNKTDRFMLLAVECPICSK